MSMREINSKFFGFATSSQDTAWVLLRVIASLMFMTHGFVKLFGADAVPVMGGLGFFGINLGINMLFVAGVIEFFGGLLVLIGLFTRWAALLCAILMVMAYLTAHAAWFPTLNGGELAAMYFVVFLSIFAYGPGRLSVDHRLENREEAIPMAGEGA